MSRPRSGDGPPARSPDRRKLTDRMLRTIPPEIRRGRVLIWDVQPGLAVAIHPTGRRSWKFVYRHRGRPRWLTLGSATAIPVADARRLAQRFAFEAASGRDPAGEKKADRQAGSFSELHGLYLGHARRFNKSWKQADALIRNHVLPNLGRAKAATISRSDIKTIMVRLADRPVVANAVLASISAVFSWAIAEEVGGVTANPCARIRRNETRSRERILSDAEVKMLWPEFDSTLKLALLTGARMTELAHMRAEDVADRVWTQPGVANGTWPGTKNGKTHKVPLSEPATALIDDHIARRSRRRSENLLARLVARHGLPKITPHDLRRTFASLVAGLSGRAAMDRLLNHSDRSVGSIYDRFEYLDQDRTIMAAVARHVARVVGDDAADNVVVRLR